jgi:hypothetical protein
MTAKSVAGRSQRTADTTASFGVGRSNEKEGPSLER